MTSRIRTGGTGSAIVFILVLVLLGAGAWLMFGRGQARTVEAAAAEAAAAASARDTSASTTSPATPPPPAGALPPPTGAPPALQAVSARKELPPAGAFTLRDNTVVIDISAYAGYAGLVVANGGLKPNPESLFAKRFGFQVRLDLGEGERWHQLQDGTFALSATTVDALPALGRQLAATVPALIGYSRGADALIVVDGVRRVNDLAGRIIAVTAWNETEFLARYLAQEAGLTVQQCASLDDRPAANAVGLVYVGETAEAVQLLHHELARPQPRLAGFLGLEPDAGEAVATLGSRVHVLTTNRNLLVVADILLANKAFAQARPEVVRGVVHGLLLGNRQLRADPRPHLKLIADAFSTPDHAWSPEQVAAELGRVHLANLAENRAFFDNTIQAGSYASIFQASLLAYGPILRNPPPEERFPDGAALAALAGEAEFAGDTVTIAAIGRQQAADIENELLGKDVRFFFEPDSDRLDMRQAENEQMLASVKQLLRVSPGSRVLLVGHVDPTARKAQLLREQGPEAVQAIARQAMAISKARAASVRAMLIERFQIPAERIEALGMGWDRPLTNDPVQGQLNRRVEVKWLTLE
jgi:NitT/TauT family transport system substrate-binding protein